MAPRNHEFPPFLSRLAVVFHHRPPLSEVIVSIFWGGSPKSGKTLVSTQAFSVISREDSIRLPSGSGTVEPAIGFEPMTC